ncbi:MAG TPA: hypothetical protein VNL77_23905 [Roseiflexaceae bacterium]|nr:hypothetical protein [Roseiflexaceae bacterium]
MRSARWWIALGLLLGAPLLPRASAAPREAHGASAAALAATPALDPELMGMVVRDPWFDWDTHPAFAGGPNQAFQDRMGAVLASAGVRWVRLDFRIAAPLSPTAELPPDFVACEIAKNDYFITQVAPRHGFKVLGLLSFDLIQGTDANLLDTGPFSVTSKYGFGVNLYMDEWLDRALMVADRYGELVAAYQVLNEQNRLPQYLPGGPVGNAIEPHIVGRLVTKLYRFCRGIAPLPPEEAVHGCRDAQIVLGGLHPRGTSDAQGNVVMTDAEYLQKIYADSSFQDFFGAHQSWPIDGIGYHPYPEEIRQSKDVLCGPWAGAHAGGAGGGGGRVPAAVGERGGLQRRVRRGRTAQPDPAAERVRAGGVHGGRVHQPRGAADLRRAARDRARLLVQVRGFPAGGGCLRQPGAAGGRGAALGGRAGAVPRAGARGELPGRGVLRSERDTGAVPGGVLHLPAAGGAAGGAGEHAVGVSLRSAGV